MVDYASLCLKYHNTNANRNITINANSNTNTNTNTDTNTNTVQGDGQQLGERVLRDVRESRGHRLVDRGDQRETFAWVHGRTHLRLYHRQTVPQLQVCHDDCQEREDLLILFLKVRRQILVRRLGLAFLVHHRAGFPLIMQISKIA